MFLLMNLTYNFRLKRTIQADKVDISNTTWIIYDPTITQNNISSNELEKTNFKNKF